MKKRILHIGAILILIVLLIFILKPNAAIDKNQNPYTFTQTKHNRDENSYRLFDVYAATTDNAYYEIEIAHEVSIEQAAELVDIIEKDIESTYTYLNNFEYHKPTILIVNWQLISPNELLDCYSIDRMAVVSKDAVYSGEYLSAVLAAAYDIHQHWLAYGIAGLVSDTLSVDIDIDLHRYYSNENNINTLDLFGGRFYSNIEGYKKQPAVNTSIALLQYIEDKYGAEEILALASGMGTIDIVQTKNDWLQSIGILHEYNSPYDSQFDAYIFEPYPNFDILIIAPFADYRLQMSEYGHLLGDSLGIQKFLYKNKMGVAELKAILNATSRAHALNLDRKIIYQIQNSIYRQDNNYYKTGTDVIHLSSYAVEYAHMHETVHFFTPYNVPNEEYYNIFVSLIEGFAGYMTTRITNEYSIVESKLGDYEDIQRYMVVLINIRENNCDGSIIFPYLLYSDVAERVFLDYYINHGGDAYNKDNFNRSLYMDAMSYAIMDTWRGNVYPLGAADTFWVYSIYESFVAFLADEYSLDNVILSLEDCNEMENIYGKPINDLFNEWLVYLYG